MIRVAIDQTTEASLRGLVDGIEGWRSPGGRLDSLGDALFRAGALVAEARQPVLLGAASLDVGQQDELLVVAADAYVRSAFWRPPLVPIVHPPDGFALQALVGTKLTISVAATVCRYYAGAAMADALVDVAVVMQTEDETQLLLDTRYDFGAAVAPLDLVISTDPAAISVRLADTQLRTL